jgi:hypothetical protein
MQVMVRKARQQRAAPPVDNVLTGRRANPWAQIDDPSAPDSAVADVSGGQFDTPQED